MLTDQFLPADMFIPDDPSAAWASLAEATTNARMRRVDLSYYVHLQEIARGKSGWLERTMQRLNIPEAEVKQAKMVISDNVKVFKLFRTPLEHGGLGYTRDALGQHSFRKLRVFAQNRDWADANRERIPALLEQLPSEEAIRELITKEKGKTLTTGAHDYERLVASLTSQDAAHAREILEACMRRRELSGDPVPTVDGDGKKLSAEFRTGLALMDILIEWVTGESSLTDESGAITNAQFITGGRYGPSTEEAPSATPLPAQQDGEAA